MRTQLLLAALVLSSCAGGTPIPAGYDAIVADAMADLETEDDFPFTAFVFRKIWCREDGGLLIEFDRGSLLGDAGYAYAMRGPDASSWGGGFGLPTLENDPEIEYFFSESPEASCPTLGSSLQEVGA